MKEHDVTPANIPGFIEVIPAVFNSVITQNVYTVLCIIYAIFRTTLTSEGAVC